MRKYKSILLKTVVAASMLTTLFSFHSNALANNNLSIVIDGQHHPFSQQPLIVKGRTFIPIRFVTESLGGSVWWNHKSRTVGINKNDKTIAFVIGSSVARVNGAHRSMQPSFIRDGRTMVPLRFISENMGLYVDWDPYTRVVSISSSASLHTYTVVAGDSLWTIAQRFNLTVDELKRINSLTHEEIYAGQILRLKALSSQPKQNSVSYITHTVKNGDNIWGLSLRYGITVNDILRANNLASNSMLQVGQQLSIPVFYIAPKKQTGPYQAETLDWFNEAQYVFSTGKKAKITDVASGRTFYVKRTMGAGHADSEPLTANDAQIMKQVWGGSYSWTPRAVIVEVDGRRLAAAMHSFPHGDHKIKDNNYNGHFCIHFLNSVRHNDGLVQDSMQRQVRIAAGL